SAFDATTSYKLIFAESRGPSPRYHRVDPRPFLDDNREDDGSGFYRAGAAFVAYLLSRYGPEPLFEAHERLGAASSPESFAATFGEVYDLDLATEIEVFLNDDTCPDDATTVPQPYACAAPTIPWASPTRWEDVRPLICVGGEATGIHEL